MLSVDHEVVSVFDCQSGLPVEFGALLLCVGSLTRFLKLAPHQLHSQGLFLPVSIHLFDLGSLVLVWGPDGDSHAFGPLGCSWSHGSWSRSKGSCWILIFLSFGVNRRRGSISGRDKRSAKRGCSWRDRHVQHSLAGWIEWILQTRCLCSLWWKWQVEAYTLHLEAGWLGAQCLTFSNWTRCKTWNK